VSKNYFDPQRTFKTMNRLRMFDDRRDGSPAAALVNPIPSGSTTVASPHTDLQGIFNGPPQINPDVDLPRSTDPLVSQCRVSGEVFVTDSGPSRAVDPWSGQGMDQKLHCSLVDQRKG